MAATQYIYGVRFNQYGGQVEVAIYDPTRWDGSGGPRFGYDAGVWVAEDYGTPGSATYGGAMVAKVSQGSIASHSPDEAALRIDVYQQAANIARYINTALAAGMGLVAIGEVLEGMLGRDPRDTPFKAPRVV